MVNKKNILKNQYVFLIIVWVKKQIKFKGLYLINLNAINVKKKDIQIKAKIKFIFTIKTNS